MRIVLTGSSGRVGRAVFGALAADHDVMGVDRSPFSTTRHVADFGDARVLREAMAGAEAVVHVAGLHAPHVGVVSDAEFVRVNVAGTRALVELAKDAGVRRFVYTSTTALYGDAVVPRHCTWIDESTPPKPATIYHRTKLDAEEFLETAAADDFAVRVVRMSRCFPEPPEVMALFRLHRGIDLRDVADAHLAVLDNGGPRFQRYIASGSTPFEREDCDALASSPQAVLARRCPDLVAAFRRRDWPLPAAIDRVYDPGLAFATLGWRPRYGPDEVFRQYDDRSIEVLPRARAPGDRATD